MQPILSTSNTKTFLLTLLKKSKQSYFTNYFQTNIDDLRNIWKGVKKLRSWRRISNIVPSAVIENSITLTKPDNIADAFNKYFMNVSSTIQSKIKFSRNKFLDFFPDINIK